MKKIIVIGASSGIKSINKDLVAYTSSLIENIEPLHVDISKYNKTPLFSPEHKEEFGSPNEIIELTKLFNTCDGFMISFAEHNGSFVASYKNVIDWVSVQGKNMFNHKPMLLMSTSPGPRGAKTVLESAVNYYPHMGGKVCSKFSLPSFHDNFKDNEITSQELKAELAIELSKFKSEL
jgi:NAD(P)H-dependent FMN reductase